jgi:transposase
MKEFLKRERVAAINRLHALYGQVGIIDVTKKDMQDSEGRKARHGELPPELAGYASILEEQLELFEKQLEGAEKKVAEQVRRHELAPYIMSIPGIGIGIAGCCWPIWGTGAGLANPDRWPIMRGWRRGWIVRGKRSGTVQ